MHLDFFNYRIRDRMFIRIWHCMLHIFMRLRLKLSSHNLRRWFTLIDQETFETFKETTFVVIGALRVNRRIDVEQIVRECATYKLDQSHKLDQSQSTESIPQAGFKIRSMFPQSASKLEN